METSLRGLYTISNIFFLISCLSVHWLTSLLKLDKYRDISCSWWYIFLNFFGGISGMFVHFFQIILNLLYVCQSVSWHTSFMRSDKFRDIASSGWDIFLNFFQTIWNFLYICQSVSWLTSLLKLYKYRDISSSGWVIFLKCLETFLGFYYTSSK